MALCRVKSKKGERIVYSVPGFSLSGYTISWGAFKMFTPMGDKTDGEGFKYIDVPAGTHDLNPHTVLIKTCVVLCRVNEGLEVLEILEGAEDPIPDGIGLEGDVFIRAFVLPVSDGGAIGADVIDVYDPSLEE